MLNGLIIHMSGLAQPVGDIDYVLLESFLVQLMPIVHNAAENQRKVEQQELIQTLGAKEDVHSVPNEYRLPD